VLPDTTPTLRVTMVFAALTGLAVAVLAWLFIPSPRIPPAGSGGWTQTASGPVGPTDRTLLVALRQDGLWEVPAGQQAQQMAVSPAVRQLGGTVATDLGWLSGQLRAVSGRLGVVLPSQPTPDQQSWLVEIAGKSGPAYDQTMVRRLRLACADTLKMINKAGADTKNEQIRQLTVQAGQLVGRHIEYIDEIGRAAGTAAPGAAGTSSPQSGVTTIGAAQPAGGAPLSAGSGSAAAQVRLPGPDPTMVTLSVLVVLAAAIAVIGVVRVVRAYVDAPSGRRWAPPTTSGPHRRPVALRPVRLRRPVAPLPPVELGPRGARRPW
jgi:predicted outer membrane protein